MAIADHAPSAGTAPSDRADVVEAPAKLTLSLGVVGRLDDGYHEIDAEMVTLDLADTLELHRGDGLEVVWAPPASRLGSAMRLAIDVGDTNLVRRALALVGRQAAVRLTKRVPAGGGLGGGSADAAAVLWWAGVSDPQTALWLGSDVPFCLRGGHARVRGTGAWVEALPFRDSRFVLLVPPLSIDTGAVYRAWDEAGGSSARWPSVASGNDLAGAACSVAPALLSWRDAFGETVGEEPQLAGSGSTWFIELDGGRPAGALPGSIDVAGRRAPLVAARTTPARPAVAAAAG